MSIFKRIVTTVHANVEKTVASMENHEALIQASLKDSRRAVAAANIKLQRLNEDEQHQRNRIDELGRRIDLWTQRASAVAEADQDKAIQCLRQRRIDQRELADAKQALTKHQTMTQQMQDSVNQLQQRVNRLQRQHLELQSRDTLSRATARLDDLELTNDSSIDAMFDRWEESIQEREMRCESSPTGRSSSTLSNTSMQIDLNAEFNVNEEQNELQQELEELMANQS